MQKMAKTRDVKKKEIRIEVHLSIINEQMRKQKKLFDKKM